MRHASTTTPRLSCLAVMLLAGAGLAACTVSAEADIPDLEVTKHDLAFAGIPGAAQLGDVSTELSFTQDRASFGLPDVFDASAKAVKVDLIARKGITGFDFLRTLRVTMAPSDASVAPVEIINYDRATGPASAGGKLSIPSANPVDLLEQWKSDSAAFTVELSGALPEHDWSFDLAVHFSGRISYAL